VRGSVYAQSSKFGRPSSLLGKQECSCAASAAQRGEKRLKCCCPFRPHRRSGPLKLHIRVMAALHEQLRVPCQEGATVVAIDHLPDDVSGVLQFLESEGVPLSYWWDLARAYLAQGRTQQYLALLNSALEEDLLQAVEDFFKRRPTFEIVQLLCGLAAHHIEQYRLEQDKAAKQQHLVEATKRINAAKKEGPDEQLPYLAAGCLALAKVRLRGGGGVARLYRGWFGRSELSWISKDCGAAAATMCSSSNDVQQQQQQQQQHCSRSHHAAAGAALSPNQTQSKPTPTPHPRATQTWPWPSSARRPPRCTTGTPTCRRSWRWRRSTSTRGAATRRLRCERRRQWEGVHWVVVGFGGWWVGGDGGGGAGCREVRTVEPKPVSESARSMQQLHTPVPTPKSQPPHPSPPLATPRSYKAVLRRHPGAPAEVRLGLAACFFRAGHMDLAQAAYERWVWPCAVACAGFQAWCGCGG